MPVKLVLTGWKIYFTVRALQFCVYFFMLLVHKSILLPLFRTIVWRIIAWKNSGFFSLDFSMLYNQLFQAIQRILMWFIFSVHMIFNLLIRWVMNWGIYLQALKWWDINEKNRHMLGDTFYGSFQMCPQKKRSVSVAVKIQGDQVVRLLRVVVKSVSTFLPLPVVVFGFLHRA